MVDYDRPMGIPLLTFSMWLLAFVIISVAVYGYFHDDQILQYGLIKALGSDMYRLFAIILYCVAILVSGIGLMKSSSRGRDLLVLLSIFGTIHGAMVAITDMSRGALIVLLCVGVIIYMMTPRVAAVFRSIDSRKAVNAIEALESYRRSKSHR